MISHPPTNSPSTHNCGNVGQSACGEKFAYVDILQNPDIRAELPKYADWPTFPQLFVAGELVGGCDIIMEMYNSGELLPIVKSATSE